MFLLFYYFGICVSGCLVAMDSGYVYAAGVRLVCGKLIWTGDLFVLVVSVYAGWFGGLDRFDYGLSLSVHTTFAEICARFLAV